MLAFITTLKMSLLLTLIDLQEIRTDFQKASLNASYRETFHDKICNEPSQSATMLAYQGSAKAMMAEVAVNPYSKYSLFKTGAEMIDRAASQEPKNAEIRYLRFLIQSKSPSFLGYNDEIEDDFNVITQTIANSAKKETWMQHFEAFIRANNQAVPNG